MLIVGEKINTTRKEVQEAVARKDSAFIRQLARRQYEAGAHCIDVNCGSFIESEPDFLSWLVKEVQGELDGVILCIDSPNPAALESALKVHQGKALINSISGETKRFEMVEQLVLEYSSKIVVLCMNDLGIPQTADARYSVAGQIIDKLTARGVNIDHIYVDPLIQPISVDTKNGLCAAETIHLVRKNYPGVHTICGLSNISFGLPLRRIINQAYLVLCTAYGLDAVILDPEDEQMMSLIYAAEALLNRDPYCVNYSKFYRKRND